jgi:hypothetical protein
MANKIQFNPESKEIWAFDLEGQEHYFAKPLDYYIDILNSPNNSLNSFYHSKGPSTNFHRYQAATVR